MDALFTPHRGHPRLNDHPLDGVRVNADPLVGFGSPVQVDFTGRAQDVYSRSAGDDALTLEEFTSRGRGKIVWMDQHTYINFSEHDNINDGEIRVIDAHVELHGTQERLLVDADDPDGTTGRETVLALLTTCDCKKVEIYGAVPSPPVSAFSLSQLLTRNRNLELTLIDDTYDEDHVRALDTAGTDLKIMYNDCDFTDAGLDALLDSLRNNRGPTTIYSRKINSRRFAGALRDNHSLKELALYSVLKEDKVTQEYSHEFFQAIKENQGLVELSVVMRSISDENWSVFCDSLGNHPTLERLDLCRTAGDILDMAQKTTRMQSLLKMLQVNTVLHTIDLTPAECNMHIYTKAILPRLTNTPQFRSVSQTRGVLRSKLLGRALYSVNDNPTLLWMFLSNNIPVAFAGRMPKSTGKRKNNK
jgi:hypothetical protein